MTFEEFKDLFKQVIEDDFNNFMEVMPIVILGLGGVYLIVSSQYPWMIEQGIEFVKQCADFLANPRWFSFH